MDRNVSTADDFSTVTWSLSARRAWIEIFYGLAAVQAFQVALRKESVDRNNQMRHTGRSNSRVALRKESVDRNLQALQVAAEVGQRRSPQGERG